MIELKENCGLAFFNKEKPNEKSPDYSGSAKIDGIVYKVSAWKNVSKSKTTYLNLKFTKVEPDNSDVTSEEIPF